MVAVGILLSRRIKVASDFLIAGRKLGLWLTTGTLVAVQIGVGVTLGGAELAAEYGMWPGVWFGIGSGGGLILAGLIASAPMRRRGGYVPLDFFASRYSETRVVRLWAWFSNIPSLLGVFVAQIMAAGSVLSIFGFSYSRGIILIGLVIMVYSVSSGMWGVVVTDFIQVGIIVVGIPIVAIAAVGNLGGDSQIQEIVATPFIPPGMLSRAVFIILPFLLALPVSYDAFMRYQSAESDRVAKYGCVVAGILVVSVSICVGLAGAAGRILYATVAAAEVFPHMIKTLLSPLSAGIVVAALLAAAMSSANCILLSLAGSFTRDLYNKVLYPIMGLDELKHTKLLSRAVVVVALIVGILIAFRSRGILNTMILFNYPYMASMLVPLLGGILWKGATTQGAFAGMIAGGTVGILAFTSALVDRFNGLINVDLGLLMAYIFSFVAFVLVSLKTTPRKNGIRQKREHL